MFGKTFLALTFLAAPAVQAGDVPPAMSQYIYADLMSWINHAQIVQAIRLQNDRTSRLTTEEIIERDSQWRAQVGGPDAPLVDDILNAPLSEFLRSYQANSDGRITEVFVMDRHGLNVAASTVTADYWQGDEAIFQQTFAKGSGSVFIDEVALDEGTQTYRGQVSFAVTDPATGIVVGAITVGLNAGAFF